MHDDNRLMLLLLNELMDDDRNEDSLSSDLNFILHGNTAILRECIIKALHNGCIKCIMPEYDKGLHRAVPVVIDNFEEGKLPYYYFQLSDLAGC